MKMLMPIYCFPAENGSNPTMAVAATAAGDQQLQQTANLRSKLWAIVRSKSAQQQRLGATSQLMASTFPPYSAVAANKCMNLLLQQQQSDTRRAATALMMGEDMHKCGQSRLDRNEFPMNGSCSISSNKWREESSQHVGSPTGLDSRDPYDLQHGARMFGDTPKTYCGEELEEQADLQQAIELQGQRLMGL
ncbi:hypothetical protein CsSME_00042144 [Camellia sinensis var. sinensis]